MNTTDIIADIEAYEAEIERILAWASALRAELRTRGVERLRHDPAYLVIADCGDEWEERYGRQTLRGLRTVLRMYRRQALSRALIYTNPCGQVVIQILAEDDPRLGSERY